MFYCDVVEHEAGWGSKPDGKLIALTREAIDTKKAALTHDESYELFWRFSPTRPCVLSQRLVDMLPSPDSCVDR